MRRRRRATKIAKPKAQKRKTLEENGPDKRQRYSVVMKIENAILNLKLSERDEGHWEPKAFLHKQNAKEVVDTVPCRRQIRPGNINLLDDLKVYLGNVFTEFLCMIRPHTGTTRLPALSAAALWVAADAVVALLLAPGSADVDLVTRQVHIACIGVAVPASS